MAVLGSMMLSQTAIDEVTSILTQQDFFMPSHQTLFRLMRQLSNDRLVVDLITLKHALNAEKLMESVGGIDYLVQIVESVPSALNAAHYAKQVADLSTHREVIKTANAMLKEASDGSKSGPDLVASCDTIMDQLRQGQRSGTSMVRASTVAKSFMNRLETIMETGTAEMGVPTGLIDLDRLSLGMMPSDLIYVGGRTGMGKTSMMVGAALSAAKRADGQVVFFSMEMSREELVRRMISMIAGVPMGDMLRPGLSSERYDRMLDACDLICRLNLTIDDTSALTPVEMNSRLRKLKANMSISTVFADHVGFMKSSGKSHSRAEEVGQISKGLKGIAKEFKVPVVAAVQINRGTESRSDKRPTLSDIRESGDLEQDADKVFLLYTPSYYAKRDSVAKYDPGMTEEAEIIVAKHRNGPSGVVHVGFQPSYARFVNIK